MVIPQRYHPCGPRQPQAPTASLKSTTSNTDRHCAAAEAVVYPISVSKATSSFFFTFFSSLQTSHTLHEKESKPFPINRNVRHRFFPPSPLLNPTNSPLPIQEAPNPQHPAPRSHHGPCGTYAQLADCGILPSCLFLSPSELTLGSSSIAETSCHAVKRSLLPLVVSLPPLPWIWRSLRRTVLLLSRRRSTRREIADGVAFGSGVMMMGTLRAAEMIGEEGKEDIVLLFFLVFCFFFFWEYRDIHGGSFLLFSLAYLWDSEEK